ncbi:MAG: cation transporter, partial [Methyloversatilis sp.]|nr:cation transporter [Methyloversatilis sp.]
GLTWLDPLVAMLGGLIILRWAWQLARDSATVLLDRQVEGSVFDAVLGHVDEWGGRPLDIHLWLLAPGRHALVLTVAGSPQLDPEVLRARLAGEKTLAHVTLDLRVIDDASGAAQQSI